MKIIDYILKINWLKIMKISCTQLLLLFLFAGVSYARPTEAQVNLPQKIDLATNGSSIAKVLKRLERQTDIKFVYSTDKIDVSQKVSVHAKGKRLDNVLDRVLLQNGISYKMINDRIVLLPRNVREINSAKGSSLSRFIQLTVKGNVTNENGEPLIGVTVKVKGTNIGTVTNVNGAFTIEALKQNDTLIFTYIGYETKEVPIAGQTDINVQLAMASKSLNEVIVVGYGTQKKVNLTGAVSNISAEELEDRPITNMSSALQGTMSGVTVQQSTGQPGADHGSIRIRGIGTLNNSDPMVVIDGVIGSLNDINPNDIASISVLKDAASAAIYGSRAANGVILITTKKGKAGELTLHYSGYVGKQSPTRLPDFLPSWQAAKLYNQVQKNEGRPVKYTEEDIQKFKSGQYPDEYPNTDWLGLLYQGSGIQQSHYLDFNGGTEKTQYMFSLGYFDQKGVVENSAFKRFTSRLNLSTQISEKLKVSGKLAYTRGVFQEPTNPYTGDFSQIFRQVNRIGRTVPYKYSNGYYGYIADGNPIAWLDLGATNNRNAHNFVGVVDADMELIKGLHLKPLLGYRLDINRSKEFIKDIQYYDHTSGEPTSYQGPNSLTDNTNFYNVITLQALLDYSTAFNEVHNLHLLAGYSQEYTHYNFLEGYRKDFLNNNLSELNAGPTEGQKATGSSHELALQSVFGRVNYNYKSKYLLEANLRYDGSSRFAQNHRWGLYPSVSAGWNISEEPFFGPLKSWLSHLKLRASWGTLGNQNIVNTDNVALYYPYIPTISAGENYDFNNTIATGIAPTKGANEDIMWETTEQTNVGLDAGFWQGKLTLTADYFIKNTYDILLAIPVGAAYGLTAPVQNAGAVRNKGWEFTLSYQDKTGDFSYNISGNAAFIKNEVTDLHGTGPIIDGYHFMQVGFPIQSFYGYISEGIFQTEEQVNKHATQSGGEIAPGDLMYKDLNNDGEINGEDRTYLGTYFPKMTYGINIGASWKGIDVTIFLQGAAGVKGFIQGEILGQPGDEVGKPTSILLDAWTPENHSTTFPRLWSAYTQNDPMSNPSSFWVKDAGYMRMKNLQVGYTLPDEWLKSVGIQKARIYYSGQNILTFSAFYDWVDPEAPAGERGYTYPQVLVNTVGIDLTF